MALSYVLLTGLCLSSCEEELPTLVEPGHPIDVSVSMPPGTYSVILKYSQVSGLDSVAAYMPAQINMSYKNMYDEVFQDSVAPFGKVIVWDIERPDHRAEIELQNATIAPLPSGKSKIITLHPKASVSLSVSWDHTTGGMAPLPFWDKVPSSLISEPEVDSAEHFYRVTRTIHLALQAHVRLFATYGSVPSSIAHVEVKYKIRVPWSN